MNAHPASRITLRPLRAFTLVELLTVIAIIGVLAAIIIPTVGKVRTASKRSQGVSNLRQIMVSSLAFMADNKGKWFHSTSQILATDTVSNSNYYPVVLTRYMGSGTTVTASDIFSDPLLAKVPNSLHFAALHPFFRSSYSAGSSIHNYTKLMTIQSPSKQVLFADNWVNQDTGAGGWSTIQDPGQSIWGWPGVWGGDYTPVAADGARVPSSSYGKTAGQIDLERDPGQAKLGFMDGHVEIVKREVLYHRLFDPRF